MPIVAGVEHRNVDVGGVRLHVAEAGDGPPLVLLHGWPQHWWCWRHLIPRLAQSYRVIAPDLRGFGWSSAPDGDYSKATFAADILALLDAEGLDRVRLMGHDWGGFASFLLAFDHPDRVERLVVLDIVPPRGGLPTPHPRHLGIPIFASYQVLLAAPVVGQAALTSGTGLVRSILRAGSGSGAAWTDEELDTYATVLQEPARARASSACYRTFLTRELPSMRALGPVEELGVPTLLIMGEESPLRRVLNPAPRPDLRVEQIAGAGHFLPEEAPDEVFRGGTCPDSFADAISRSFGIRATLMDVAQIATVRDGRITRLDNYEDRAETLEAVGAAGGRFFDRRVGSRDRSRLGAAPGGAIKVIELAPLPKPGFRCMGCWISASDSRGRGHVHRSSWR